MKCVTMVDAHISFSLGRCFYDVVIQCRVLFSRRQFRRYRWRLVRPAIGRRLEFPQPDERVGLQSADRQAQATPDGQEADHLPVIVSDT